MFHTGYVFYGHLIDQACVLSFHTISKKPVHDLQFPKIISKLRTCDIGMNDSVFDTYALMTPAQKFCLGMNDSPVPSLKLHSGVALCMLFITYTVDLLNTITDDVYIVPCKIRFTVLVIECNCNPSDGSSNNYLESARLSPMIQQHQSSYNVIRLF